MSKNYVYRMDHDTGSTPNVEDEICIVSGCKDTTVEQWVEKGSWILGIGGNCTGQPDKLIYILKIKEDLSYKQFKENYPDKSAYGKESWFGDRVLIPTKFYYFGDNAIELPSKFEHLIWDRQGCKKVSDEDINHLHKYLSERYDYGKHGGPTKIGSLTPIWSTIRLMVAWIKVRLHMMRFNLSLM